MTDLKIPLSRVMDIDIEAMIEQGRVRRQAEYTWTQANTLDTSSIPSRTPQHQPARVNVVSLTAWLAIAAAAGVKAIPARPMPALDSADYLDMFDTRHPRAVARTNAWEARTIEMLGEDEVLRFEHCAPSTIKAEASIGKPGTGREWDHEGKPFLDIWSERFFETFRDLHTSRLVPFARPYVAPLTVPATWTDYDGQAHTGEWPVEFRVFVRGGRVIGASAYYPQAPLGPQWLAHARRAVALAQQITTYMDSVRLGVGNGALCADTGPSEDEERAAWIPHAWGPQDFTLDFLCPADGSDPVFLEGGPGGWRQAAPCCFESDAPGTLEGIKLALDGPTSPLHG